MEALERPLSLSLKPWGPWGRGGRRRLGSCSEGGPAEHKQGAHCPLLSSPCASLPNFARGGEFPDLCSTWPGHRHPTLCTRAPNVSFSHDVPYWVLGWHK